MTRRGIIAKALFLDIDGVLVVKGCHGGRMSPACVAELRRVVETTKCALVLSSSWRFFKTPLTLVCEAMRAAGWEDAPKCAGHTTTYPGQLGVVPVIHAAKRGQEIADYMAPPMHLERYAIVDDDGDMLPEQAPFFVQTDFDDGLTGRHADRLISILGAE